MMCYITLITLSLISIGLLVDNLTVGGPLRIANYSSEQYMYGALAGLVNSLGLVFKIIAF